MRPSCSRQASVGTCFNGLCGQASRLHSSGCCLAPARPSAAAHRPTVHHADHPPCAPRHLDLQAHHIHSSTMSGLLALLASRPAALAAVCAAAVVTALLHSGRPASAGRPNHLLAWLAGRLAAQLPRQADPAQGSSSSSGSASSSRRSSRRSSLDGASDPGGDLDTPRLPGEQPHWRVSRPAVLGAGGGAGGSGWRTGGAAAAAPAGDLSNDSNHLEALLAYSKLSS